MRKPKPKVPLKVFDTGKMSMNAIEVLPELLQTRATLDKRVVLKFSQEWAAGSVFPPVIVYRTPEGRYLLADGFHRYGAAEKLGLDEIQATVIDGTIREALLAGIKANLDADHFRTPTPEDKVRAVELMIRNEEFREWSDPEIARRCSSSSSTIRNIRVRLFADEGIVIPSRVMRFSKDGVFTGVRGPYRNSRTTGKPTLRKRLNNSGTTYFQAQIDGKTIYLGTNEEKADRKAVEALSSLAASPRDPQQLLGFLRGRNISGEWCSSGILTKNAFLVPVGDSDHCSIQIAVGIAVLAVKTGLPPGVRLILVGHFGSLKGDASSALSSAKLPPLPIETMTPEEVVAEFGPKPDADADTPTV